MRGDVTHLVVPVRARDRAFALMPPVGADRRPHRRAHAPSASGAARRLRGERGRRRQRGELARLRLRRGLLDGHGCSRDGRGADRALPQQPVHFLLLRMRQRPHLGTRTARGVWRMRAFASQARVRAAGEHVYVHVHLCVCVCVHVYVGAAVVGWGEGVFTPFI